MYHIVTECENREFTGILEDLHAASNEAVQRQDKLDVDIWQQWRNNKLTGILLLIALET